MSVLGLLCSASGWMRPHSTLAGTQGRLRKNNRHCDANTASHKSCAPVTDPGEPNVLAPNPSLSRSSCLVLLLLSFVSLLFLFFSEYRMWTPAWPLLGNLQPGAVYSDAIPTCATSSWGATTATFGIYKRGTKEYQELGTIPSAPAPGERGILGSWSSRIRPPHNEV